MKTLRRAVLATAVLLRAWSGEAQVLPVYDDELESGFQNYSYGGGSDFASAVQVHSGAKSIAFTGGGYNALSFAQPVDDFSTATYPVLRFWVHGGAAGGQQLRLYLQRNDGIVGPGGGVDLDALAGGLTAGAWKLVSVDLTASPVSYNGLFDRIDIQSDTGAAQAVLYLDDISLGQQVVAPTTAMTIERGVTVDSMVSDRFTWQDSRGEPRVAVLAHNDNAPVSGYRGGALRRFEYRLPDGSTRSAIVTTYGNAGYGGFGYAVSHARSSSCGGGDSPLGGAIAGTFERVFEGRHHAIFRFRQNYPRNCSTNPARALRLPIAIDWMVRTGSDHPLWSITWHVDQLAVTGQPAEPAGTIDDDSRAPYGELAIDGTGFTNISGVAWGDRYKFTSTTAPVHLDSSWEYDEPNSVPYIKLWIDKPPADPDTTATMGLVQTQTIDQQDAGGGRNPTGGYDISDYWGTTSVAGDAGPGYTMPYQNEWPYQANSFSIAKDVPNNNARLTWGTQYGFLGRSTYAVNDGVVVNAPGYPKKNYSLFVVLDTHRRAPVEAQVAQIETLQTVVLSATTGSVANQGAAGADDPSIVQYSPAGYDHVYSALVFEASSNAVVANIAVGNGTLVKPLVIVRNYTAAADPEVRLGGIVLEADVDYFASLRADAEELWITLNRNLTGATNALAIGGAGEFGAPTGVVAEAINASSVEVSWQPVAGAASYEVHRQLPGGTMELIAATEELSYTHAGLSANTTFLYRVRAIGAGGESPFSNLDPATTIVFTDDPLVVGVTSVRMVHVTQLRTAVNAMRVAASLDEQIWTDAALTTSTRIKAVHITQLRAALVEARDTLGLASAAGEAIAAGTTIKAAHVTQLREGVK